MKKRPGSWRNYNLAMQISSILLCSTFGSLGLGIWLDRKLGTIPCLTLLLMILGLAFAMYAIYRTVNEPK